MMSVAALRRTIDTNRVAAPLCRQRIPLLIIALILFLLSLLGYRNVAIIAHLYRFPQRRLYIRIARRLPHLLNYYLPCFQEEISGSGLGINSGITHQTGEI